ncbi:MAG: bifunctional DNA-formamidopyrimidine glycosylase/DNA-(apurinic or apyrimidinic site) lyase [Firmicutes bacterium]|nr:bifunctional DNA-formamidopyrimidine glycosylase/DNA-(apurinic or apyrimidinic site) lyase [Bacillota bacterium]
MPELPEVETIRAGLEPHLLGQKITGITVLRPSQLRDISPEELSTQLIGKTINRLSRRGKYLLFYCSSELILVVHLRMTGQLLYYSAGKPAMVHTRLIISLEPPAELHFHDVRALGQITLLNSKQLSNWRPLLLLGPEPLGPDFTLEYFQQSLACRRAPIKNILLGQRIVAGLGNIYTDEALFKAGINPLRPANMLSEAQVQILWTAIRQTLTTAVADGGTTIRDYLNSSGISGSFQRRLQVYGRKGQKCRHCGSELVGCRLAGRSTVYCPHCQPL